MPTLAFPQLSSCALLQSFMENEANSLLGIKTEEGVISSSPSFLFPSNFYWICHNYALLVTALSSDFSSVIWAISTSAGKMDKIPKYLSNLPI